MYFLISTSNLWYGATSQQEIRCSSSVIHKTPAKPFKHFKLQKVKKPFGLRLQVCHGFCVLSLLVTRPFPCHVVNFSLRLKTTPCPTGLINWLACSLAASGNDTKFFLLNKTTFKSSKVLPLTPQKPDGNLCGEAAQTRGGSRRRGRKAAVIFA